MHNLFQSIAVILTYLILILILFNFNCCKTKFINPLPTGFLNLRYFAVSNKSGKTAVYARIVLFIIIIIINN